MTDLRDKVVWITGASSGIGEELAKQIAALGNHVVLSARRVSELERVAAGCTGALSTRRWCRSTWPMPARAPQLLRTSSNVTVTLMCS